MQGLSEADRALEQFAEPVLTIYHNPVRSHRHSEDLARVVPRHPRRPGDRPVALSAFRKLEEDLRTRKAAVLARKDGRYGEVELLALYLDSGVLVSTYNEPPSQRPWAGPCPDPLKVRASFGLDAPDGIPQPPSFAGAPLAPASPEGLYRAIATGKLRVHDRRRGPDGTLMALATYPASGRAVHLHGEGDQRHIAARFDTTEQARAAWHQPQRRTPSPSSAADTTTVTARRPAPRHR